MNFIKINLLLIGLFSIFFIVPAASAHRPEEGNEAGNTVIPDANTSFAYYRQIDSTSPIHFYSFEGQAGQFFHAGINIPQIQGLEDYQVSLALLGPGLPNLEVNEKDFEFNSHNEPDLPENPHGETFTDIPLPAELSEHQLGGLIVEGKLGEDFFEPFTQTSYWGRQELDLDLPETGKYYLIVWNPEGKEGKYVLDTGTREVFGPTDLFRFPIWWLNTRLYFEQGPSLALAGSFIFFGMVGIVIYRVRKKSA